MAKRTWGNHRLLRVPLFFVFLLFFQPVKANPPGYPYFKLCTTHENQITVGGSNLINFPVLVRITDNDLKHVVNGGKVEHLLGYDIIFTSSDGNTIIPHQLEKYNAVTGELVVWVKVPVVSSTVNTNFYMYFGNSSVSASTSSTTTWDANYVGVWHLHNDWNDATSNTINLTSMGPPVNESPGVAADGEDIEPTQHLSGGVTASLQINGNVTLETWVNFESALQALAQENVLMSIGGLTETLPDNYNYLINYVGAAGVNFERLRLYWETGAGNDVQVLSTVPFSPGIGTWHHITVVRDVTNLTAYFYVDGVQLGSPVVFATPPTGGTASSFRIGKENQIPTRDIDADFDEPRVSNIVRIPEWVQATYQTSMPGSTFVTYASTGCVDYDTSYAGPDQNICVNFTSLAGNTMVNAGTGTWTLVSGAGTITSPNSPTSGVTGLGVGANVFQWSVTNGPCPGYTDQVTITFDGVPPTITCPPNQTGNVNAACGFALPNYTGLAVASDNCGGAVSVTQTPVAGTVVTTGVTAITLTATDANGTTATCTFNVTVSDITAPVFTFCPSNIAVNATAGTCSSVVSWIAPTASDNCTALVIAQTSGLPSGSAFPVGVNNVVFTATDASGNATICSFTVTVTDLEVPVFTSCPTNISVNTSPGLCGAVVTWTAPAATDNCTVVSITQTSGLASGSTFPVGATNVVFTATDSYGNSSVCAFTVSVTDIAGPTFTSCPANVVVNNTPGTCGATVSWPAPVASDNCAGAVTLTQTVGPASGSSFPVGVTNISYTATDATGNTSTCSFTVTVIDNQPPVFTTCPSNITSINNSGACSAVVSWPAPVVNDNCAGTVVTQTAGLPSGAAFPVGVTTVTFTATDAGGNASICSFTVTVTDSENPVFSSCPANIALNTAPGLCTAVASWVAPSATDNCGGMSVTQTAGSPSGSSFPAGVTTITYTATDASGNVATCSFTISVTEAQPPIFTFCPANIVLNNTPGSCGTTVNWVVPTATDNCPGVTVTQSTGLASGSFFPIGVSNISYTATDAAGNTTLCSFSVTVNDNQVPVYTFCPANISAVNTPGICGAIVTWVPPAATDNCPGVSIVQTTGLASGSVFPVGVSNVSFTATDVNGNNSVCAFTVTVTDGQSPTFTTCPGNISVNTTAGLCNAVVSWAAPVATDNCPGVALAQTAGLLSGASFPVGITTVTYTATDASGNAAVCSFTVTVTDNQPPVFTSCPGNISVTNTPGSCNAVVSWAAPVASENCAGLVVSQIAGLPSGSAFPIGVTNISFSATDAAGNTALCSFTVTVTDNQPPVFTSCPLNITVNNTAGVCGATVNWVAPTASDNCAGTSITQTTGPASGSVFPVGVTNISFTVTDASGNTATCAFTVTVNDNQAPVFTSCPANIAVNNNPGVCGAVINWVPPTATDNCAGVVVTQTSGPASGTTFPIGTTNVSFTATDVWGNSSVCAFTVTVTDNQAPAFTSCPGNISVNNNPGLCSAIVSWVAPVATDNCAGLVITQTTGLTSGSAFPIGTTVITYTATDAAGNVTLCTFNVTVTDNQLPVFSSCPVNIAVNSNPGLCSAIVSWVAPAASDNCAGMTLTQTAGLPSGSAFPIGVTNISFTATDASGNSSVCSFTVTVTDNQFPTFTSCPANITVNNNPGLCSAVVSWIAPAATDNCPGIVLSQTAGLPSGSAFPIGVTNVSFTATDAYGNSTLCSFTVTVNDNQPPVFTSCPANSITNNTPGLCSAVVNWAAPAISDNCPGSFITQTAGPVSGSSFPIGVTNVVFTATDAAGNTSVCSFTVTVIDNQVPSFVSCPANIVVNNGFGACSAVVSWVAPVVTDNCAGVSLLQTAGPVSGSAFPIGVTNVSFTATDAAGNTSICAFTVTVIDNQVPVFTSCPTNISVSNNPGVCGAVVAWVAPVASDNCAGMTLTQTSGLVSGSLFPIGVTNISFTATDASGNTSVCSFTVTVTDNQIPIFTSCPTNISVNNTAGLCSAVVTWIAPTITDNCPGAVVTQTAGLPSGSSFPIGITNIIFTATDAGGNTAVCTFSVIVTDNQAPAFTSCPGNISVTNNPGACGAVVSWPAPAATDNCAGTSVAQTLGPASGSLFPIGVTNISFTATDANGNTSVCAFTVTVTDNENPVFTSCPANIVVNSTPGLCSSTVNWVAPVATDNCPGISLVQTSGLPSGSAFPIGVSNIVFTATDVYGNATTCSFTVTVNDNQLPSFTFCPTNISVSTTPGACTASVGWVAPAATDNCPGLTITQTAGLASGSSFPIGVTTISYTATDASGNTALCTFTVTVSDNQAPVFTSCPANISVNNDPGNCSAVVTWVAPAASDNCPGVSISQTAGFPSGSAFPIGTTNISFTATDAAGNSSVCAFTVTVTDNQVPVFTSCPVNISVTNNPGSCGAIVSWAAPVANDNCPGMTVTQTLGSVSGSLFPIGTTNVSFLATDASGNTSVCAFTVTVTDNQAPVFTSCPANISVNNNLGLCSAVVAWAAPTATDNCPGVVVVQTAGPVSGSAFPIGVTTVTFTASDSYGNSSVCTFTITVTDNQFPAFSSCPANISVNNTPGSCSSVVAWVAPAASDNCPGMTLTQTAGLPSGSAFPIGVTNVSFTATDASGNISTCSFTVTVTDNQVPVFTTCPANISVNNTPGSCGAIVLWAVPVANDNCPGLVITQTSGLPSGSSFPIGVTPVSFTATDASGNTATCSFTVTVTDNQLPVFTSCPVNISTNSTPGLCGAVITWVVPAATDNCPGMVITQTAGLPSGSTFPVGVTVVTFTAADASGNTATCSFSVTIADNQAPVFVSCPVNINVNNAAGTCGAVVSWIAPAATDNCPGLVLSQTTGLPSGSVFPIGITNISFTATDASGNTAICAFTVTVTDNQLPVFSSCPANIAVPVTPGLCSAAVSWVPPSASDNCPGLVVTQTAGLVSGSAFPVGVTNVSFTATDASGNVATCSFTVTVTDNQLPVFTSCPTNIVLNSNPGLCSAIASWVAPTASDNCAGLVITQTAGLPNGSAFPIGVTNVLFTATDAGGNMATCSFTVTVTDNQLPVFTSCPVNLSVNTDPGNCSAVVSWASPTATDNCPGVSVIQTLGPVSGSTFPIGVTNIAFTASDANGNNSVCAFTVTVTDNQAPVFTSCPANINLTNTPGMCSAVASWTPPAAIDNCPGVVTLTQTAGPSSGSAFPIGVTNVVFTATDIYGNTSICSFNVTVTDNQNPVFTSCPANITVNNNAGLCSAVVAWVAPVATDNCPGIVITQTIGLPSGSTFPIGVTSISYNAIDASGNTSTCAFTVTVLDNQLPVFTSCPANIAVNNNPGTCGAIVSWIAPAATDNCAGVIITQTAGLTSGSTFPIGVTNIAYTATDASGNSSICTFTVTVTDNQVPVYVSCPININVNNTPGVCSATVTWIAPVATDNCGGMVITQTAGLPSGSAFPVGVTTVTFTATDASGNTATCTFTVTVNDVQAPTFTSCPLNINVSNAAGSCSANVAWVAPAATDNCAGPVIITQTLGPVSGSSFPVGTTNISYNATDAAGNVSVCAFTVTVTDNQFPTFTSCPGNITVNNNPGLCSAVVNWVAPVATDNCPGVVVTQTAGLSSGSAFPVGITNVSFNAADASGNITVCSFTVTVTDNQAPVFTFCPGNTSAINNPGLCGALVSWIAPAVSDNCPGTLITQTAGLPSGSLFPVGVTNVSFTASDAAGNTAVCSFTVTVTDNQPPSFVSCPTNISVTTSPGLCNAVVSWVTPVPSDNCPGVSLIQTAGPANGSVFSLGVTNIAYTAIDAAGNFALCTFSVTVTDNQPPVFTSCPGNINVTNTVGLCSRIVSWAPPAANDNCTGGVVISQNAGLPSGSSFPVGVTNVSFTATDAAGNTSTCAFTVTVVDNELPVFTSCPGNIVLNNNPGLCSAIVSWVAPAASDNCPGLSLVQSSGPVSGSAFPVGVTNVSFTATDASGNVSICSFTVTVTDNQLPVFTSCPGNITVNNNAGLCSAVVTWVAPAATDNCPGTVITLTGGLPSGSAFPVGVTNVIFTATDAAGNASNCTFSVTVLDNQVPVFVSCPANITVNNDPGNCSAVVSWIAPAATDNCAGMIITQTVGLPSGSVFPLGVTNIGFTATDAAGNSAVCLFTVTVTDNEAPVFSSCPANININTTPGLCSTIVSWAPPAAADNCPGAVTITQTAGPISGSSFPIGVTAITFTASDILGNTSLCSFNVTVSDNQPPVFTSCPTNITVNSSAGLCSAVVNWAAPAASDNCAGTVITQTAGLPSGSSFPTGVTNITFTATDAGGNTALCSFTVTVVDNQLPVFTSCPVNIAVNNNPGVCGAVVSWVAPAATDNCPGMIITQTAGLPSGSTFPIGISNISFTATDASGNTSICAFTITVTDNQAPVFTSCPANILVNNDIGQCSALVNWAAPLASDNCAGVSVTQTAGPVSGSVFPLGITNVSFTATDASGNTSLCAFTVTVVDNEVPVFSSCPVNISVNSDPGMCSAVVTWTAPVASDNCPGMTVTQTGGLVSGSAFPIGSTVVTFTATDAAGNNSLCTFTVTVTDNQVPVFTVCSGNITVNNTPGACSAVVSWPAPAVSDNCPGATIVQSSGLASGSPFPIGITNVSFTATDASGNTALCSFTVTVTDNEIPVFTSCPGNTTVVNDPGNCSAVVSWIAPAATDNCVGTVVTQTSGPASGSAFPIGTTSVSFTATDASGNTSVCNFTVTVNDTEIPVFTLCPASFSTCNTTVILPNPAASDNCAGLSIVQTAGLPSGSTFPLGGTLIEFTATDASGNAATCQYTVTVLSPVVSTWLGVTPDTLCVLDPDINLVAFVAPNAGATDSFYVSVGGVIPTQWTFSAATSGPGTYIITHVTDNGSCSDSSTHTIVVVPVADASWIGPDTLCEAAGTINLNPFLLGTSTTGGTWSGTGVIGNTFNPSGLAGTTVAVTYTAGFGACTDAVTRNFFISPDVNPAWQFVSDTICSSTPIINLSSLLTGTTGGTWSGIGVTGNNFDPSVLTGNIMITYTVGQSFCAETQSHVINITTQPVTSAGADQIVCGINTNLAATNLIGSGQWTCASPNIAFANAASATSGVITTAQGTYLMIWTESMGACAASDTVQIDFWDIPVADAGPDQIVNGSVAAMNAVLPFNGVGVWTTSTIGPVISVPTSINTPVTNLAAGDNVFTWTVTNGPCPAATDDMIITVGQVTIPGGFSPNGDGFNDLLVIPGISTLENELLIFNRWGEQIFNAKNYQNDWDGTRGNGQTLPDDTYFYILTVTGYDAFSGYIIIKR